MVTYSTIVITWIPNQTQLNYTQLNSTNSAKAVLSTMSNTVVLIGSTWFLISGIVVPTKAVALILFFKAKTSVRGT